MNVEIKFTRTIPVFVRTRSPIKWPGLSTCCSAGCLLPVACTNPLLFYVPLVTVSKFDRTNSVSATFNEVETVLVLFPLMYISEIFLRH